MLHTDLSMSFCEVSALESRGIDTTADTTTKNTSKGLMKVGLFL